MASPRYPSFRGWKIGGEPAKQARRRDPRETEEVANPRAPRQWVDYTIHRKRALGSLALTATGASDLLDPHPDLIRAARHHGQPATHACPWCKSDNLVTLMYVFSDELGPFSGRLRTDNELEAMATNFGFLDVYVVEVCPDCHWNHLLHSYVLGDGAPRPPLKRPPDLLD